MFSLRALESVSATIHLPLRFKWTSSEYEWQSQKLKVRQSTNDSSNPHIQYVQMINSVVIDFE